MDLYLLFFKKTKKVVFFALNILLLGQFLCASGKHFYTEHLQSAKQLRDFTRYCLFNLKEFNRQNGLINVSEDKKQRKFEKHFGVAPQLLEQYLDLFINLYKKDTSFMNPQLWVDKKAPTPSSELFDIKKNIFQANKKYTTIDFVHPYVQKIKFPEHTKICIEGDLHGSIHSLLRNLWRLVAQGYLDENFKIIDKNFILIFLGDFVDRGCYGSEVLYVLMKLKLVNPHNVLLLRGNHEDLNIRGNFVKYELKTLYPLNTEYIRVCKKFRCVFDLLPLALYLGCGKNFVHCSHAGFDPHYNPQNLLNTSDKKYECLLDKNENNPFCDPTSTAQAIRHFTMYEHLPVNQANVASLGFVWCDFARTKNAKNNKDLYSQDQIIFSGHGYVLSREVTQKYLDWLNAQSNGQYTIRAFIRGHQHADNGVTMFSLQTPRDNNGKPYGGDQGESWSAFVDAAEISNENGFLMYKHFPVYTFTSAPEGVGEDRRHKLEVHFNQDSYGIMTISGDWNTWRLKPYEFEISGRSDKGLYCAIAQGGLRDFIAVRFMQTKPSSADCSMVGQIKPSYCRLKLQEQDRIERIVNKIFNNVKRLHLPFSYESDGWDAHGGMFSEKKMTPSLVHLKYGLGLRQINSVTLRDVIKNCTTDTKHNLCLTNDKINELVPMVFDVLAQEQKHSDKYFVLYHAHDPWVGMFFDIYQRIYRWGMLDNIQSLPLRLFSKGDLAFNDAGTVNEFLDKTAHIVPEIPVEITTKSGPITKYAYCFNGCSMDQDGKPWLWFDHIPAIRNQLISTNLALFSNNGVPAENSVFYWAHGFSIKRPSFWILRNIFAASGFNIAFVEKICNVYASQVLNKANSFGHLLQIFIKKSVIDDLAYVSKPGGKPFDAKLDVNDVALTASWDESKHRYTTISHFLNTYINQPNALNDELRKHIYEGIAHKEPYSLNRLQVRLWAPSPHFYNPDNVKICRYSSCSAKPHIQKFYHELDTIFECVMKDHIKQKVLGRIDTHFGLTDARNEFEKKIQEEIDRQKVLNDDKTPQADVLARSQFVKILTDNKKQRGQKMAAIKLLLKKHLITLKTKLMCGVMTPLLIAVKQDDVALVAVLIYLARKVQQTQCKKMSIAEILGVNECDLSGYTPLMLAVRKNNAKIFRKLIELDENQISQHLPSGEMLYDYIITNAHHSLILKEFKDYKLETTRKTIRSLQTLWKDALYMAAKNGLMDCFIQRIQKTHENIPLLDELVVQDGDKMVNILQLIFENIDFLYHIPADLGKKHKQFFVGSTSSEKLDTLLIWLQKHTTSLKRNIIDQALDFKRDNCCSKKSKDYITQYINQQSKISAVNYIFPKLSGLTY